MSSHISRVSSIDLFDFCVNIFSNAGVPQDDARIIAEHLVTANLRSVDSHGAFVRVPYYLTALQQGKINPKPQIKLIKDGPSTGLIDGDNGFGPLVALKASELAIKKAKATGISIVGTRNMSHVGMLAHYTLKIVKNNLIGLAATSSPSAVVPWGGSKRILGTNPFSIGFPFNDKTSIILDMATSTVAGGKIAIYAAKGEKMPEGWALDKYGKPTTDPKDFLDGGLLLPFGGYKGYSLSLSVEIFSGLLTGSPFSVNIPKGWATQGGFLVEAIDIEAFRPFEEYAKDMADLIELIKSCPPAEGFKEVLLPGEIEFREHQKRLKEGIPFYQDQWDTLKKISLEFGIELPNIIH